MPFILQQTTGAVAGAIVSPLQGNQYEYLPWDAFVEFAVYADTGDTWLATIFSGSDVLLQAATLPILATASPILYPDHYLFSDTAMAGERLGVQLINQTGGVADARTAVRITPL
jgi:hypothetical protein